MFYLIPSEGLRKNSESPKRMASQTFRCCIVLFYHLMHNNFYSHVSRDKRRREEDDNSDRSKETKKSKEVGLFGCHLPYLIYDIKNCYWWKFAFFKKDQQKETFFGLSVCFSTLQLILFLVKKGNHKFKCWWKTWRGW